jgi:uncharacterized protein (UPF0332 family)
MTDKDRELYSRQKIIKAKATIDEINNLLQFGYFNTAINRIYYACFYAVQALLASIDVFPKTHKGVLNKFSFHFVNEGKVPVQLAKFYPKIFDERLVADYADENELDRSVVEQYYSIATNFIDHINKLLSTNNEF